MSIYDLMRYTARAAALFLAFAAGNMLAHQNGAFPVTLMLAIIILIAAS